MRSENPSHGIANAGSEDRSECPSGISEVPGLESGKRTAYDEGESEAHDPQDEKGLKELNDREANGVVHLCVSGYIIALILYIVNSLKKR